MAHSKYKRFVISVPEHLATQVNTLCEAEGLSCSDFFCEAAQAYLAAKSREPQYATPTGKDELMSNPFYVFSEWSSTADRVYDIFR